MTLPKYDLFIFGLTRSDYTLSSVSVAWAKEWAKTNRVFYFDRPFSLKDLPNDWNLPQFKRRRKALLTGKNLYKDVSFGDVTFTQITPRVSLPLNFLPEGKMYQFLNRYNQALMEEVIKKTIKDFDVKNYVYFNSFHPVLLPIIPKHIHPQPLANIYQSLDEISQEPYIARHGITAEDIAMKQCDIAIGTSTKLCERHADKLSRKVHLLANAADYHTFENAINKDLPKPIEYEKFTKPVIIYTGHYSDLRLDHDLVIALTKTFAHCDILFVGTYEKSDLSKYGLDKIENLHFIGSRPIESLPAYLKYAKVAIIPYKSNSLTAGIYPLKINEYLAAGIPCVSSNFSKDISEFADYIYLANSTNEFMEKVKLAMEENPNDNLAKRMEHAANNSWRKRVEKLEGIVEDFINGKPV
ncbi:MAG: glycosyltransferase [Bacteroidia bacterium]|nr:glycosyltransferase [Bacteroidia bacterium]MCF8426980.1 glycosyltransferase [Bacteroidia bacterium]MCF8445599.1 glycosyltransferase [Bacteroidia bacterium]